jgi:L-iditol 2-dehydrogenase
MLAVRKIARGEGNVEVQEIPEPHAGPDQVVIQIDSAGICGTDLHIYLDEFATTPPVTMGHEVAGNIVEMGKEVTGWKSGDRVTTETYFSTCGRCFNCRRGRRNLCAERCSIGSRRDGGFATYLVIPAKNLHRVPDGLDLESAALTEPLACTVHGVLKTATVCAGDNVAVTGPGSVGLLALQLAKLAGANVVVMGTSQDRQRLELARQLGADATIDVQETANVTDAVIGFCGGEGADLVIECSGVAAAAKTLTDVARRGARFCQMGLYGKAIPFDQDAVCYKELVVTGTNASASESWPLALKLLVEGKVEAQRLISHRFPIQDWEKALDVMKSRRGVKVLLKPDPTYKVVSATRETTTGSTTA